MTADSPPEAPLLCLGWCGLAYREFALDVLVADEIWAQISGRPDGGGVMCVTCMVKRAAQLPGVTVGNLSFDVGGTKLIRETPLTKAAGEMLEVLENLISNGNCGLVSLGQWSDIKDLVARAKGEQTEGP